LQIEQQPSPPEECYKPTQLDPSEFPPEEVAAVHKKYDVLYRIFLPQYDAGLAQEHRVVTETSTHSNNVHNERNV